MLELVTQPEFSKICGHCCVAMITNQPLDLVIEKFKTIAGTSTRQVSSVLWHFGYVTDMRLVRVNKKTIFPALALLSTRFNRDGKKWGHWVALKDGIVYDPGGLMFDSVQEYESYYSYQKGRVTGYLKITPRILKMTNPILDELKQIRASLKTPEERSENWRTLLMQMARDEESMLAGAIGSDPPEIKNFAPKEIEAIKEAQIRFLEKKEECLQIIKAYKDRFDSIIARMEKSVQAHRYYLELMDYAIKAKILYDEGVAETEALIEQTAQMHYKMAIQTSPADLQKYIKDSKSMITGFMFQAPLITDGDDRKRSIGHYLCKDWDANKWVMKCYDRINELFKNYPNSIS